MPCMYLCANVTEQGDFTRTGERKLAGVMKDGVNSANRYYLNRFRDAYRQAVIGAYAGLRGHCLLLDKGLTPE